MDTSAAITLFLQFVATVGFILTAFRLYSSGIFRKYRIFFIYLIFSICQTSILLVLDRKSPLYFNVWMASEPVLWILYILVVMELYSLVLERYKGLYTVGRIALWCSVILSVCISGLTLLRQVRSPGARESSNYLPYFLVAERGVVCAMLIFLFLILMLLTRYPVRLSRNVIVHCGVYTLFFLTSTLTTLLRGVFGVTMARSVNMVAMGINALCVLIWVIFLDARGEAVLISASTLRPEQETQVLEKLAALNATVLGAGRK